MGKALYRWWAKPENIAMDSITALAVIAVFYAAPLLHILVSPSAGPLRPPPDSRCPIGPRVGWLVLVLLLGPIGWLMFMTRRGRNRAPVE
jgi:hypothetical protein